MGLPYRGAMRQPLVAVVGVLLGLSACAADTTPAPNQAPALAVRVSPNPVMIGQALSFQIEGQGLTGPRHVALFVEYPDGSIAQLLPNRLPGGQPTLTAGQRLTFPSAGASYRLQAAEPTGTHTVLAYASAQPLDLNGISSYASEGAAFATVQANRQGKGSLEGSFLAVLRLNNPGLFQFSKFDVSAAPSSAP